MDKGIILVKNQNYFNLTSTCDERKIVMNGNYLINFNNCSVKIGKKILENRQKEFKQSFAIPNYLENVKDMNKKLVFDDIVLKQIENINEIREIKYEKKTHYIYGSIITFIVIIIITFVVTLMYKHKRLRIMIKNVTQESPQFKEGGVTSANLDEPNPQKPDSPEPSSFHNNYRIQIP